MCPVALERFLIDRGETVVRLPPRLMADARQGVRERGKSDPIDALAIARAALGRASRRSRQPDSPASSSRSGCWLYIANGSWAPGHG